MAEQRNSNSNTLWATGIIDQLSMRQGG